jgi:CRISPR-associated protein Csy3
MAARPKSSSPEDRSLETGMLAFTRSIQITEGVFFGVRTKAEPIPVEVLTKGVRGQSSEDKAKNAGKSNPQAVEFAVVPQGCDSIELKFSVRVLDHAMQPHACDDPRVSRTYTDLASTYAARGGFRRLAELYTWNVANGRFAWRNRWQTDSAEVRVDFEGRKVVFDPLHDCLRDLDTPVGIDVMAKAMSLGSREDLDAFVDHFAAALQDRKRAFTFSVVWAAAMQPGQEVFPSQEYIRDEEAAKSETASRVYAKLPRFIGGRIVQQASMHSQKIGAALRHIDVWHGDETYGAIAVNPYGGVQESGEVLRNISSKLSFYDLRRKPEVLFAALDDETADAIPGAVHFVMANLVRGGVFGKKNAPGGN